MKTSTVKLGTAAVVLVATLGIGACSSVSVASERYIGAPSFAPTSPASVEILRHEPRRPHERIGEVILSPSGSPEVSEMEAAIRSEAAKLGADAAVLVYDRTRRVGTIVEGPWWARSAHPVYGRKIVAVAIKFQGGR